MKRARTTSGLGLAILGALAIGPTQAGAGTLRGSVADRQGMPAAGAEVWAAPVRIASSSDLRRGVADAEGRFALEAPSGRWVLWARRGDEGGRMPFSAGVPEVREGSDPAPVAISLKAPSRFRGRLLDAETGEPIAGGRFALDDARIVAADAEGRFEAPGLETSFHRGLPLCPGYERRTILFDTTARPEAELDVRLAPAGKVEGRVLDEHGEPIPGASVSLGTAGTAIPGYLLREPCDADGRFAWDGLGFGRAGSLSAAAPGFLERTKDEVVAIEGKPAPRVVLTLARDPARPKGPEARAVTAEAVRDVSGRVVAADGRPVAGALVRWGVLATRDALQTRSDERGAYRLGRVPRSEGLLSVVAPGFAPAFPVVLADGDREVNVTLDSGDVVRGRVVDDAGTPIAGVEVIPLLSSPRPGVGPPVPVRELSARTDAEGRFRLEGMPEAAKFDLLGEGFGPVRSRSFDRDDPAKNVVVLEAGGAIRGLVVDPAGNPARNFRVLVKVPRARRPGDLAGGFYSGYSGPGILFTSGDGTFVVGELTAGNIHDLEVLAEGYGEGKAERVEAQSVNHLPPAEALTIRLAPPHTLRVRVFCEGGRPVAGARVTLVNGDPGPTPRPFSWGYSDVWWEDLALGVTDADGRADFPALGFDKATVVVRAPGFARRRLAWRQDEEEILVDLEPESSFSGTVEDERGRPLADVDLVLRSMRYDQIELTIDPTTGRFSEGELPAGRYTLTIRRGEVARPTEEPIEIEPGEALVKDIRFDPPPAPAPKPGPG